MLTLCKSYSERERVLSGNPIASPDIGDSCGSTPRARTAVIILNWNNSHLTLQLVEQFLEFESECDIVVVDNFSKREERDILTSFFYNRNWAIVKENEIAGRYRSHCRATLLLLESNYGYARGNNYGMRFASRNGYEFVLVSNNDVILEAPVLGDLLKIMDGSSNIALIGPVIIDPFGNRQGPFSKPTLLGQFAVPFFFPIFWPLLKILESIKTRLHKKSPSFPYRLMGCFMLGRLSVMKEIDFFDENTFLYAEELILAEKLRMKGFLTAFEPTVHVKHLHAMSTATINDRRRFEMNLESDLYYFKNYRNYGRISLSLISLGRRTMFFLWIPLLRKLKTIVGLAFHPSHCFRQNRNGSSSDHMN